MKASSVIVLTIFTLFWTAMVGAYDVMIVGNLFRTMRALDYPETTGTILSSEVTHHRGSKGGTTYGVAIHYRYEVGGGVREGDRYRYSGFTATSDSTWAYDAVRQNPAGASVKVYFNPANPDDAVLARGITGGDIFIFLFLTPFNMVMVGLWAMPVSALARKICRPVAGGVKWWTDGRSTRVRLPRYSPCIAGLVGTGGTAFVSVFVLAFGFGGNPSLPVALGTLMAAFGVGMGLAGWHWLQQRGGKADLVMDDLECTAELPANFGRKQRRTVPWSAIKHVVVEAVARRGKRGTSYTYAVNLRCDGTSEKLAEWSDQQRAESFATWLRRRFKPGEPAVPPRKTRVE